jgi:hypothetical protein
MSGRYNGRITDTGCGGRRGRNWVLLLVAILSRGSSMFGAWGGRTRLSSIVCVCRVRGGIDVCITYKTEIYRGAKR